MGFQPNKGRIIWKVHFNSPQNKVFEALTTDEGRQNYWAEFTKEKEGFIEFNIIGYSTYKAEILEIKYPSHFRLTYFGTEVTFKLESTIDNGTNLTLEAKVYEEHLKNEMTAGWVSVLMAMKAAVDHNVDLRNHNLERTWDKGFLDN